MVYDLGELGVGLVGDGTSGDGDSGDGSVCHHFSLCE